MATPSQQPLPDPAIRQQYQPPPGAIPIYRLKRVGIGFGVLVLGGLTLWGIYHKPPAATGRKSGTQVFPMNPGQVDFQQAELDREIAEAKRVAQEAEYAKQRAQHGDDTTGPRNVQLDPATQLRMQLRLEDLRRQHQAAFASNVAFAAQKDTAAKSDVANESGAPQTAPTQSSQTQAKTAAPVPDTAHDPPPVPQLQPAPDLPPGMYRLDEGTIIEATLLNRLQGELEGPVIAQVSQDVYSRAGLELLIPRGSRLLGEARAVNSFDQRRLAIFFHRLILPNQKSLSLDKFRGLDQIGATGVVSKVDHHYLEIFGTSLALGGIGGLMQIGAYGSNGYDPSVGFRVGFTERMGSSAEQVLAKFLNKYPTIKVLEGARIKIILTNDLNVEAYE